MTLLGVLKLSLMLISCILTIILFLFTPTTKKKFLITGFAIIFCVIILHILPSSTNKKTDSNIPSKYAEQVLIFVQNSENPVILLKDAWWVNMQSIHQRSVPMYISKVFEEIESELAKYDIKNEIELRDFLFKKVYLVKKGEIPCFGI